MAINPDGIKGINGQGIGLDGWFQSGIFAKLGIFLVIW